MLDLENHGHQQYLLNLMTIFQILYTTDGTEEFARAHFVLCLVLLSCWLINEEKIRSWITAVTLWINERMLLSLAPVYRLAPERKKHLTNTLLVSMDSRCLFPYQWHNHCHLRRVCMGSHLMFKQDSCSNACLGEHCYSVLMSLHFIL